MTHTGALLEILIIGLTGAVWVVMALFHADVLKPAVILQAAKDYKDWAALVTFAVLAMCYQLGWIVNTVAIWLGEPVAARMRTRIFGKGKYDSARTLVYEDGDDSVLGHLDVQRNAIRLTRAGIVNFMALTLVFSQCGRQWRPGVYVLFGCSVLCFVQFAYRCGRYYRRLKAAHDVILRERERKTHTMENPRPATEEPRHTQEVDGTSRPDAEAGADQVRKGHTATASTEAF
jgi:hypothetical protein